MLNLYARFRGLAALAPSLPAAGALLSALLLLSSCATPPPADDPEAVQEFKEINDPLEPTNRTMFAVHEAVDQAVLQPVAEAYRALLPEPIRNGVRNMLGNLRTPVILTGDMLQGNLDRARTTLGRFMVNSTIGLAGINDVALLCRPGWASCLRGWRKMWRRGAWSPPWWRPSRCGYCRPMVWTNSISTP